MIQTISSFFSSMITGAIHFLSVTVWPLVTGLFITITHTILGIIASVGVIGILIYGLYSLLEDH